MTTESGQAAVTEALGTASALKLGISRIVASDTAGRMIGAITRRRIRHHGLWFDTRSSDFTPSVRAQMFWGGYESAETRMIRSLMRNSTAVVELGSSLGVTAAHIADAMVPGGHLVCVEANPHLIPGLRERMSRYAAKLHIEIIHAAVTDQCGTATLTIAPETVGSRLTANSRQNECTVEVPALTLKEILHHTAVAEFDLVSDIEGSEVSFLLQEPDVLGACQRAVIELHETATGGREVSVFDLMDAAAAAGFETVSRHGPVIALARP